MVQPLPKPPPHSPHGGELGAPLHTDDLCLKNCNSGPTHFFAIRRVNDQVLAQTPLPAKEFGFGPIHRQTPWYADQARPSPGGDQSLKTWG